MTRIINTSPSVEELFTTRVEAAGLDKDRTPHAVQLAISALSNGAVSPFTKLLEELPASARAFDWMECAFSAYAEWCARTIVVDEEPGREPRAADSDS